MSFLRRRRVGAASLNHHKIIKVLYPKLPDSQVTPLGTYTTNHGRVLPVKKDQ